MIVTAWLDAGVSAGDALAIGQQLDAAGVSECWLSEAYIGRDPTVLAALLVGATSRMRIGVGVFNHLTRDPVVLAMTALTFLELAPGRFRLGVGTGEPQWMGALGYDMTKPLTQLKGAVERLQAGFRGDAFRSNENPAHTAARIFQRDAPPEALDLVVGAVGPRMCRFAASINAAILLPVGAPSMTATVREELRAAGLAVPELIATLLMKAGPVDESRNYLARKLALMVGPASGDALLARNGLDGRLLDDFRQVREENGLRAAIPYLPREVVDAFCLYGGIDLIVERLAAYREAGLDNAALLVEREDVNDLLEIRRLVEGAS